MQFISSSGPRGAASAFDPDGERVWKRRDAVICMQRGEREAESLLIFRATAWDERLLSYLQVHEHNEIFILLSAAGERARTKCCLIRARARERTASGRAHSLRLHN